MGDRVISGKGNCEICKKESDSRCGSCHLVFYCSQDHQKKDWKKHKTNCSAKKYRVEWSEKLGKHMVATEELKCDTSILKDKPLILGPKQGVCDLEDCTAPFCFSCYKNPIDFNIELDPCELCDLPVCSEECSEQFFHRNFECRFIQEVKKQETENPPEKCEEFDFKIVSRKISQCLLYFRCVLMGSFDSKHYTELLKLESNAEQREDLPNLEKTTRVFNDLTTIFSYANQNTLVKPDLHKLIGIIDTNSVDIKLSARSEIVGVYPVFALVEHSCCPNTRVYFIPSTDKRSMYELCCRSSAKIKAGGHISATYTNILWNTEKRRDYLKKQKYFWCECERCLDPFELGSNFSTLNCPVPECDSFCTPVLQAKPTETNFYWQCQNNSNKCGKICESWQVKKVDARLSEIVKTMLPTVKNYKDLLAKIEELVHPDYYLNFVVNHSLIQMLGQDSITRNDTTVLDEKLKLCNRLIGLIKKLDPGLGILHVYAGVVYYEMHSAILAMVGGEGDEDFLILRKHPESVKLSKVYLEKCIECFKYELLDLPETKLKLLASKKLQYLNMLVKK